MKTTKLDTLTEHLAEEPSNSFGIRRKIIAQCQSELGENNGDNEHLRKKVKIEIYNSISKIPEIVRKYVNTHTSYSIINAMKDIQISLKPYLDYFVSDIEMMENGNHTFSKSSLYRAIRHYLQVVDNNRQVYKQYKNKPRELLQHLRPDIKVDNPQSYSLEVIFEDGIIVFVLPDVVMNQLHIDDKNTLMGQQSEHFTGKGMREGGSIGRHLFVIIRRNKFKEDMFLKTIFGEQGTLEHELQHAYNAFYMENDLDYVGIQAELYNKAKDEIIAQFQNNEVIGKVIHNMKGNGYDYIGQKMKYRKELLYVQMKRREERIRKFEEIKAPEQIMKSEKQMMAVDMSDMETISNPDKLQILRQQYYTNLQKYIQDAGIFINRSLHTKKIEDPYMILAITPIDQRDTLAALIEIGK